jgi:hypothetical protein
VHSAPAAAPWICTPNSSLTPNQPTPAAALAAEEVALEAQYSVTLYGRIESSGGVMTCRYYMDPAYTNLGTSSSLRSTAGLHTQGELDAWEAANGPAPPPPPPAPKMTARAEVARAEPGWNALELMFALGLLLLTLIIFL